jgi:DNA polymerase elongation subunit (family B)
MNNISNEVIENFLQGSDPQKYIVAIEAGYNEPTVTLVINDPETGKRLETHPFKPFLWFKKDITEILYEGKRLKTMEAAKSYGVKITALRTSNSEGFSPDRLEHGYKYMATCNKSYNDLIHFFKAGGVDVFNKDFSKNFVMFRADEQFLIQTGKRLFKGMDDYDDVHRFQFDLETTGLFASKDSIFQIGVRDNRKLEHVLEVKGETFQEKRDEERATIEKFFKIIDFIQPDIITGYNSENFDWPFLFERAERLSIPITELAITLNRVSKIKRKPATVKFGGETEHYEQTNMYGYNIIDISHAVRRAMAINSEIKSWGLKYITQYSEIAKPNRVYVPGDKIGTTWKDKVNQYAFNDKNGDWYMITEKNPLKEGYVIKKGDYIVQRYLCDDLWETEQIDNIFNQASFLIAKMLPTSFQRSSTMGTAGQWKLIMAAWSYENGLAIPETQTKREFTGGLSRLLELGFARNVYKLDYAALYPKTQITHKIFPDLDISGVMEGILTYVVDTRDKFKFLTGTEKKKAKKYEALLKEGKDLTPEQKEEYKKLVQEHKALSNLYDKKQLPLKILANSWFGSYGAPYIFNWGDTDSAEETTCRGRQYLRLMIRHFTEKHGFRALVMDTDGANFAAPDNINEIKYVAKGTHWKTIDDAGKELIGIDAALAEFNETYMEGRMGLDLDDVCSSTINFARKNYANDIGGKIKLVGNSVKSKKMSVYIEEFLGKGIRMLLDGDGHSFINYYYDYVDKIYNYQIPLVKIASKAKIKSNIADYKKKATLKNKAGNPMPKQAHMELAILSGLDVTLGDTLFYINTGTSKSHGDLKTIHLNKMTKRQTEKWVLDNPDTPIPAVKREVQLNCKLIDPKVIEHDFELIKELEILKKSIIAIESEDEIDIDSFNNINDRIEQINSELYTDEYNVAKYLDAFNKKIKPLLVCFNLEVRGNVLLDIIKIKDKTTKKVTEKLKSRAVFTIAECELVSGISNKQGDQDSYEDLMCMEDKEIKFWIKVNKLPNNMTQEDWDVIQVDYIERMRIAKEEGIKNEKNTLDDIFKHLELQDLKDIITKSNLPVDVFIIADIDADDEGVYLVSRKWGEKLCSYDDIFKYKADAIERDKFYQLNNNSNLDNRYELYLEYLTELHFISGNTTTDSFEDIELLENTVITIDKFKEAAEKVVIKNDVIKKKKILTEGDEDEDDEFEEDEDGNLTRTDEILQLDDEFDDTFGDMPEGYVIDETAIVNGVEKVRYYSEKEQILIDNGFIEYNGQGCWVRKNWLEKQSFVEDMIVNEKRAYDMVKKGYGFNSWLEKEPEELDEWGF